MKEKSNEKLLEIIKKAIGLGFSWACNECYWDSKGCPIAKVAKEFDSNFKKGVFCSFDIEKVIDDIIYFIRNLEKPIVEEIKLKEKVILWHTDGLGGYNAFDIFVKKRTKLDKFEKDFIESLYKIDCEIAQKFLTKFSDYEYLGSEGLLHIDSIKNEGLKDTLVILYKKGWQRIKAKDLGLE